MKNIKKEHVIIATKKKVAVKHVKVIAKIAWMIFIFTKMFIEMIIPVKNY